jgi:hypothetical protein
MLEYGQSNTYLHELDKERLEWITHQTRRGNNQTQFLYQLVDGDFEKLKQLELKLQNNFIHYCPSTREQVEEILNKPNSHILLNPITGEFTREKENNWFSFNNAEGLMDITTLPEVESFEDADVWAKDYVGKRVLIKTKKGVKFCIGVQSFPWSEEGGFDYFFREKQ